MFFSLKMKWDKENDGLKYFGGFCNYVYRRKLFKLIVGLAIYFLPYNTLLFI